jgi:cyclophilin family peptidyl-prolyl cis-trans isomerase
VKPSAIGVVVALLAASPVATADVAAVAQLGPERVVFHTVAGDLVFALYPHAAPRTVQQFLSLARAGVYDTTAFSRIAPGFIAQVSVAQDRTHPLTAQQSALLQPLPLETSTLRHVRGALSLAHPDGDPSGGQSSFCVMLGSAPHLDGKYTVFGRLEAGDDVLAELVKVPRLDRTPTTRLTIDRAEVMDVRAGPGPIYLAAAHPVGRSLGATSSTVDLSQRGLLGSGLLLIVLLAAAAAWFRARLPQPVVQALLLAVVLVGSFLLLAMLMPEAPRRPWLACLLFFGTVGVFKVLGRFETAADR